MKLDTTYKTRTVALTLLLVVGVFIAGSLISGCTDTLDGERFENQAPIVYFANIPPEDQTFSRNPLIYYFGTDRDGLIDFYRYHVALAVEVDTFPSELAYINSVSKDDWVYVDVDPASAEPQTRQAIPLRADTTNPVRNFVEQYVFLQGFDMEGLGSEIAVRRFSRNDNPPTTIVLDFRSSDPFVNAESPGGIVTGVRLAWQAEDPIDYPSDPPPFQFQWRLYGPYDIDTKEEIMNRFALDVFQTNDGFVYLPDETLFVCDTTFDESLVVNCDTFVIGTDEPPAFLGTKERFLNVADTAFALNPEFNKVEDSSCVDDPDNPGVCTPWTFRTSDTLYNVFKDDVSDTTIQKRFIFWIRSRDDALVPDPTPDFDTLSVIDPKFERDIFIFDMTQISQPPPATRIVENFFPTDSDGVVLATPTIYDFFEEYINGWNSTVVFEPKDFAFRRGAFSNGLPLKLLLQHKVVIIYNDAVVSSSLLDDKYAGPLWKAIDAGVNAWMMGRAPIFGSQQEVENPNISALFSGQGLNYSFYFAVNRFLYSGWFSHAFYDISDGRFGSSPAFHVQDCLGAYSLDESRWPNLEYDPDLVRDRYNWLAFGRIDFYRPDLPFLPEINWAEARFGAEVMYLYKSFYGSRGASHPLGYQTRTEFDYNMEGAPVGHRFNSGLFRTVHFCFTPFALEQSTPEEKADLQMLFSDILTYLYDPSITVPVSEIRYPGSSVKTSVSEARARYWQRADEQTLKDGGIISEDALRNLRR